MTRQDSHGRSASSATAGKRTDRGPRAWWHRRDHAVVEALGGFYAGVLIAIVVPGAYAGVLGLLFDTVTAESLFPYVLLVLVVPIALLVRPRTRRFGGYLLLGIVLTVVVVVGVAAVALWYLVGGQSG